MNQPIFLASDHGGYQLKRRIMRYFNNELHIPYKDMGPYEYDETDDYPDYVIPLAHEVAKTHGRGIVICKNGVGVSIAVNKVEGIRCGIGYSLMAAETMMKDDNTNILSLPAKHLSEDHALAIVKTWLETPFSEAERHVRRINKMSR
jgi:ribose 5-phosphate isomerase B